MNRQIDDKQSLLAAIAQGWQPKYLFFWGHTPSGEGQIGPYCLSQWYPAPFTVDGVSYPTSEHFMMAEKARLFQDDDACSAILAATHPGEAKKLGRKVRGFVQERWDHHCVDVVYRGNLAKFNQNEALKTYLLVTGERVLVEASPADAIWGIGLAADARQASDPRQWPGLNLLGFALMRVRESLHKLAPEY